jgi:hypothetical protein
MVGKLGRRDSGCHVTPQAVQSCDVLSSGHAPSVSTQDHKPRRTIPASDYCIIASHRSHAHAIPLYDGDDFARPFRPATILSSVPIQGHCDFAPASPSMTCPTACATFSLSSSTEMRASALFDNTYIPVSARSATLDSLQYDYGIRYKRRVSSKAFVMDWRLLIDEDAAPCRFIEDMVVFKAKKKAVVKQCVIGRFTFT